MHSLMAASLLGIDSFVLSAALSPLFTLRGAGWRLAMAFGGCDAIAFLIGSTVSWGGWASDIADSVLPAAMLGYGVYVLAAARWSGQRVATRPAYLLPFLMSFDNLAYGLMADAPADPDLRQAATLGLASGALSLLGLAAGNVLSSRLTRRAPSSAGAALIAASLVLLLAR
jgi:putative Mn2+ efflux pump MntP